MHKLALVVVLLVVGCNCHSLPSNDPRPVSELHTLVSDSVHSWLDMRMDNATWQEFSTEDAAWRSAESLEALELYFPRVLGASIPALWDFGNLVEQLKESALYERGPPSDDEFLELLIEAMKTYEYESEEA